VELAPALARSKRRKIKQILKFSGYGVLIKLEGTTKPRFGDMLRGMVICHKTSLIVIQVNRRRVADLGNP